MLKFTLTMILVMILGSVSTAQDTGDATTQPDTSAQALIDTSVTVDSLVTPLAATIDDSIRIVYPMIEPDTLSENQRLLVEFETRFFLRQQEQQTREVIPEFSYFDSLVSYYVSPRWNLREDIDRSFYHDAGDYLKSDPRFFVLEPQVMPLRKTAQPFGLAGNRLGFLIGGQRSRPFEHIVEPDGMTDLNDLPTALDHTVAVLPGPVGMVFGGDHAVATLLTMPKRPASHDPESSFLVDKGGDGFSFARGRYSRDFTTGRRIDMSIAYRKADGPYQGRDDDAYHYTGDFRFPVGAKWQVNLDGRLYNRFGAYLVRPDGGGVRMDRDRFDRSARLMLVGHNEEHTVKHTFGYQYTRQGSSLDDAYRSNLGLTGQGLVTSRQWAVGRTVIKTELAGDYLEYDNWHEKHSRWQGRAALSIARLTEPTGFVLSLRQDYVEDFRFLPVVSAVFRGEFESAYLMLSTAYSERAPSLNELFLPYQEASVYVSGEIDYADGGHTDLVSERQFLGAVELAVGKLGTSLTLAATGGRIWDGIDWQIRDTEGMTVFAPVNGDITFADVTGVLRLRAGNTLNFKGGGSFHYVDYEEADTRPYTPEYQAFSGAELHLFWSQKLIDLYAYGELVYTGPYDGYVQQDLGNRAVINTKLSFRMGHFRFHWTSQNVLLEEFSPRDQFNYAYRFTSYGFIWDFLD